MFHGVTVVLFMNAHHGPYKRATVFSTITVVFLGQFLYYLHYCKQA